MPTTTVEQATKSDLQELKKELSDKIDNALDDIAGIIKDFSDHVAEKF